MKIFTVTVKAKTKRLRYAPKTQPHKNKKAYRRNKKVDSENN